MASHQSLISRVFWFGTGGLLSVAFNAGPFVWMRTYWNLSDDVAYAISLGSVTVIFSIWNYFINFRTHRSWRDCLPRYLTAVALCALINYLIARIGLKEWGQTNHGAVLVIGAVQVAVSGIKFLLYHFWVYPHKAPEM